MDDYRIVWFKKQVYRSLAIKDEDLFNNFVTRDDRKFSNELKQELDSSASKHAPAILFYLGEREEEEEVEVVEGVRCYINAVIYLEQRWKYACISKKFHYR